MTQQPLCLTSPRRTAHMVMEITSHTSPYLEAQIVSLAVGVIGSLDVLVTGQARAGMGTTVWSGAPGTCCIAAGYFPPSPQAQPGNPGIAEAKCSGKA